MNVRCLAILALLASLSQALHAQPLERPAMLHDAETTDFWNRDVTLVPDGKAGQAVRYRIPGTGRPSGPRLELGHLDTPITADSRLVFWYRFAGEGTSSLHVKLMDPDYAQGWQATWQIGGSHAADGRWHQGEVDLATPWMRWGENPVMGSRCIMFRTQGSEGSELTLDLDHIQLVPRTFAAEVGQAHVLGERAAVGLVVRNATHSVLPVEITGGRETMRLELPAQGERRVEVEADLPPGWLAAARPLDQAILRLAVAAADRPWSRMELAIPVAKPLSLPPHPRLLANAAELAAVRERMAELPWAKSLHDAEKRQADALLDRPVELPPRGGQWWHWYACKKDGARLRTVSPTEHRCPVCGEVYSGWPYDDVILDREHNRLSRGLRSLGLMYQLHGDRRYAERGREILLAYAERYTQYPLHNIHGEEAVGGGRVGPQTLDESTWLIPMCQGADLLWDTLSEEDRRRAETGLFRPAAEVIRQHRIGIHNIQCWKNSAVGLVGLLLGDANLVADAVTSPHGFHQQIARGISADGQWYEGAWGYHFYTMSAVLPLAEAGERCGLGLYAYTADGRSLRGLFDAPLDLAMPSLHLPAFNDSGLVNVRGQARHYELALARYGDPRYAAVIDPNRRSGLETLFAGVEPLPEPPVQARGSRNFPESGYAILEHGSVRDAAWLCLKYGPHGGGHGHPDKLNVSLHARGLLLGLDPGTAAYGVPIQREWFRATLAHNTLTVDEACQTPAEGTCLAFGTAPALGLSAVIGDAGPIYPGLTYRRAAALFGEDLVLLVDLVAADSERTFDLAWHNAGTWATPPAGENLTMPDKIGYMHLRDMVRVAGKLPLVAADDSVRIGFAVASTTGGETWAGRGFHAREDQRPVAIVHRARGKSAVVVWAISLRGEAIPEITVSGTPERAQAVARVAGREYRMEVAPDAPAPLAMQTGQDRLTLEPMREK